MVKYVLDDILRVRNFRKDIAERNFTQAQKLVKEAEENVRKAEGTLQEFQSFIVVETNRLYNQVMKKMVKRGAVDSLNVALKNLKNRLFDYKKAVENEKENLEKAEKNADEKRQILLNANKNIEKLNSHKETWIKEALKEEEMASDKELEEFTGNKSDNV